MLSKKTVKLYIRLFFSGFSSNLPYIIVAMCFLASTTLLAQPILLLGEHGPFFKCFFMYTLVVCSTIHVATVACVFMLKHLPSQVSVSTQQGKRLILRWMVCFARVGILRYCMLLYILFGGGICAYASPLLDICGLVLQNQSYIRIITHKRMFNFCHKYKTV